jgi:uncharacterized protein
MPGDALRAAPQNPPPTFTRARRGAIVPRRACWFAAACLLLLSSRPALAEVTVTDPRTFVVDQADVIDSSAEEELEKLLKQLERQTTAQVKVLTVKSLDSEEIVSFAQRHFVLWKLGQKGKDNGALIVLSLEPHRIRIHTGYGLEGALPDSWCGTLSRHAASEYFKQGRYSEGIRYVTLAVINKVADEYGVKLAGAPRPQLPPQPQGDVAGGLICVLFLVIFLIPLLISLATYFFRRKGRQRWGGRRFGPMLGGPGWYDMFPPSGGSSWGGGWGSGGGFGGGGSFGGGSFGGGGDSGGGGGGASW